MAVAEREAVERRLWTSPTCYESRWRKSASALVAVQQALDRHRPLRGQEQEFLELYQFAAAAPPDLFGRVWTDPRAYLWVRVAFELVKACLTGAELSPLARRTIAVARLSEPCEALDWHLEQFKLFALAVALRCGRDIAFRRSWEPRLPVAIPASCWSLSGTQPVMIHGLVGGRLQATTASKASLTLSLDERNQHVHNSSPDLVLHRCPLVEHAGASVWIQPHAFHVPAIQGVSEVLAADIDFPWQSAELVRKALAAIEQYDPGSFAQFRDTICLIALKPRGCGSTFNTSHSQLPGAFTASAAGNSLTLADDFIHELHHNRLFALEEAGPFFDEAACDPFTDASFYSPWRCDSRPLHGVLHALYVFTRVARYWLAVYCDRLVAAADRDYATDRLLRLPRQLALAAQVLRRRAAFTPRGQTLFDDLQWELDRLRDQLGSIKLPADAPALALLPNGSYGPQESEIDGRSLTVLEAVEEHRRLYDLGGDCDATTPAASAAA